MVKFEAKIYGKNLDDLNDKLIKFLKGKKKLLRGRTIDTITDDLNNLYLAIVRIDDEQVIDSMKKHFDLLNKRDKRKFLKTLSEFIQRSNNEQTSKGLST